MSKPKIAIIGAGLSGLVAAYNLEEKGYSPTIYEAGEQLGGRLQTELYKDTPLDRGFQVLLTAYPMAQKYLDYTALQLQPFLPGAVIFDNGKRTSIGDPLRSGSFWIPTLFSKVGSVLDKWKILQLTAALKRQSVTEIFNCTETSTYNYLLNYGFSNKIISQFFKPFFSGIFLEEQLDTSSRMFQFVFKMFAEGKAAVPVKGMQEIPRQLRKRLRDTSFHFSEKVIGLNGTNLSFEDGTSADPDFVVIAADPSALLPDLNPTPVQWHGTQTLYFGSLGKSALGKPILGLVADSDALVNNLHYVTDIVPAKNKKAPILSVTVVKEHDLTELQLIERVKEELQKHCGIGELEFIRCDTIRKALPHLPSLTDRSRIVNFSDGIFLAGDYLANGSINSAMLSGELAAIAVDRKIRENG